MLRQGAAPHQCHYLFIEQEFTAPVQVAAQVFSEPSFEGVPLSGYNRRSPRGSEVRRVRSPSPSLPTKQFGGCEALRAGTPAVPAICGP